MYSKILSKLVLEATTPFLGFLFLKILITFFSLKSIGIDANLFNLFNTSVTLEQFSLINTNIIFSFVIFSFLGLSYSLIKSLYFHNTHVTPRVSLSVFNLRVGFLIQDSFHLFSQNIIWLSFNCISLFLSFFMFYLGLVPLYLIIISSIFTILGTYFFALDVEYEIQRNLPIEEDEEIFIS